MSSGMLRSVVSYKLTDGLGMKHWSISRLNDLPSHLKSHLCTRMYFINTCSFHF
jgi:hypothetical protein